MLETFRVYFKNMQNLENLDVFEILITQKLLKCPNDPFVRSALKSFSTPFKPSNVVFILLINVQMPTIVRILTFMSKINFMVIEVSMKKFL